MTRFDHWEHVYRAKAGDMLSWYQREPTMSLRFLEAAGLRPDT